MFFIPCLHMLLLTVMLSASSSASSAQYNPKLITQDTSVSNNLRTLLEETLVIDVPGETFNADISYLALDFKLDPECGTLKMCEFGEAKNASPLLNCPITVNGQSERACAPFCNLLWHYLAQFNIPIWYVGQDPIKNPKKGLNREQFIQRTGWHTLKLVGGMSVDSLEELQAHPLFKKQHKEDKSVIAHDISTYKGIIFYNYRDDRFESLYKEVERFKKKHPGFLFLDGVSRPYAANKRLGCSLFDDPKTALYKPRWKEYEKQYTPKLASKIFKDLKCDTVVIKPENSGRSNGILMAGKRNLDSILQKMLAGRTPKRSINYRPLKPQTYQYWKKEKNKKFIVEEYCPSQPLLRNNKWYDPTIRSYALMRYDKGKIYINIFQGFWKIPNYALSEDESFVNTHCTKLLMSDAEKRDRGIRIEEQDVAFMRTCLNDLLPQVYLKMLQRGPQKFF